MLGALGNGIIGGKWYALMDKVCAPRTLWAAWKRVASNQGAANVDRISIRRVETHAQRYLEEVEQALRAGSYQPAPVKRVHIPKGKSRLPVAPCLRPA